jgi:hypothetical protein
MVATFVCLFVCSFVGFVRFVRFVRFVSFGGFFFSGSDPFTLKKKTSQCLTCRRLYMKLDRRLLERSAPPHGIRC